MKEETLRTLIREELSKSKSLNESQKLNRAYDAWHDACSALSKLIRKEMGPDEFEVFSADWDNTDSVLMSWFNENDPMF